MNVKEVGCGDGCIYLAQNSFQRLTFVNAIKKNRRGFMEVVELLTVVDCRPLKLDSEAWNVLN
jgi:hypothetical protein